MLNFNESMDGYCGKGSIIVPSPLLTLPCVALAILNAVLAHDKSSWERDTAWLLYAVGAVAPPFDFVVAPPEDEGGVDVIAVITAIL